MTFIVEPPIGALNTALNTGLTNMSGSSKILLGIIVAGMMAVDMGGPFNKAAYVFGTASIAAGNYDIMAAVMIGGMVPPCAIALGSMLFKNKFTKEEEKQVRQTLLWVLLLLQKELFHLQRQIRSMCCRLVLLALAWQEHYRWRFNVL